MGRRLKRAVLGSDPQNYVGQFLPVPRVPLPHKLVNDVFSHRV